MRYLYIALIVLVTALILTFKIQNLEIVTLSLLGASVTMQSSTMIFLVYLLGMVTGSAVFGLLRRWIAGACQKPEPKTDAV